MKTIILRCLAEKDGDVWVGHCLSLDLSVHGKSLPHIKSEMKAAVENYFESINSLPSDERDRVRMRRAPFGQWLKYYWASVRDKVLHDGQNLASFDVPKGEVCPVAV